MALNTVKNKFMIVNGIRILTLLPLIIFCSLQCYSQKQTEYSLIGTWKVFKTKPVIDYKNDRYTINLAHTYMDKKIIFKKDSIISNIDYISGEDSNFHAITKVSYLLDTEPTKTYFDDLNYASRYLGYKKETITTVTITYLNTYLNEIDTLYAPMEFLNADTIHVFFDVVNLFLRRIKPERPLLMNDKMKSN